MNHPEGHSFGARGVVLPESLRLPEGWRDCEEYLFGMDLFNHAYLWEAHEAWEACWHAAGHASLTGGFLQGLIQIAAALLKHHGGVAAGAVRLAEKAARRLDDVERRLESPAEAYMGVRLPEWRLRVEAFLAGRCDEFPSLVLDFR